MFPVNSPQRFEAPPMVYPLQMQCVSQPLQVPNPFAPVVYTSTAPSNVVLINESPPRPPLCNQVFLPGTVQGVPQQLMPQQMVSLEPRFSPGAAPPQQLHSPAPFVNPQMPPSVPLGVPSSQPSSSGKRISSEANVSGNMNLNRGFPLPTTPYGFLDGSPQMSTCSSDTMLDGSKKEFMITRAEKVSLWRTFATVFHNGKNTELETTDNSLLAVFLGLPSHIRRAIRHLGGIGAFLKECPWFVVNGDKVELVPCMEKLYTCQDDDVTESTEKEEVKESDNAAEVPDTWEDLSISDIEEGGYFGDYVPSEPENSDGENTQKCPSQDEGSKTSTKEITGEFLVGKKDKEKLVKEEKKPEQLVSGQREQGGKMDKEENVDDRKEEKDKSKKRSLAEREEVAHFVKDEDENVEGKCSEHHEEAFGADKSPSSNTGVFSDHEVFSLDGNEAEVVKEPLTSSGSRSCQNAQQLVHQDSGGDKFASPREILRGETVDFSVDARGDESLYIVVDEETYLSPTEIWDVSDDPDSDELKELFAKVDLAGGPCPGDSEGSGRGKESKKSKKVTLGGYKESKEGIQSPDLEFKVSSTKDAETSSSVETRDKMMQTSDNSFKCHVQTDVSGLGVDDDDEKVISGKDVSSQTLEWICQPEPQKIMVDCCVDSCDLKPLQGTVSTYTEPVLQRTVCVNTDPAEENKECSDKCKKILASCKSDLQKATLEQMETEGRLCQTVSRLKQMERECTLLKEIRGSVIADLIKGKEKPQMEEKSTSADLTFDGDALKKLQKSLSEAKVKLLHGNLKNVELQSKLALQLISQAYEESELIYTMKKMSISRKASLATQIVKYQRQLQSHREAVDDWKRKSEAFLMAGGVLEKLPLFPQIDIEKFTPEVPVRGPLRHPSQPCGGDFKLAANFTGQPVTSAAPPYQTTTGMEAAGRHVPLGGVNESKVSPMSTFTPNKKSDRPGTSMSFKDKSTCNEEYSTSVSDLDKGNLIKNMGLGPSQKGSQLTLGNTDVTMEAGNTHRKGQLYPPTETSPTESFQDNDAQSTTAEKMSDAKPDTTSGKRDTHRQNQQGSSQLSSVDGAIIDFNLDELNTYQPSAADAYMYMQQVYASQYEYAVDPYYWFGTPLGLYNGQFPVPPTTSYGSLPPENSQTSDEDQMNKQGGDYRPDQKSPSDVGGDTSPIDLRGSDGQASLSQPTPSISPDSSPSESGTNQENKPRGLQAKISQCNLPDEMKSSLDVEYATLNTQGAAGDVDGLMKTTSYTATLPLFVEPVQQDATSQPSRQSQTGSRPFIFGLPSSSESEVSHIKGEMAKDEIHKSAPGANSLAAASQVPHKPLTLEPTSFVQKNDAKQIFTDTVTSTEFQKVSIDKTTICHPNQVKSGKRMAAPVLQANIGLDDFDSLSIRSPKKKRVRGNQKEEMKTTGSGETTAEVKESQGKWIHMVGKKKKRNQEQVSQKKQQEPQVISHPGEDEHIPNYFSLTHLLRKLSEMFPNESRLSLTSIILKVRANYRGQLDKVPFAVIISEAVSLLTASDSSDEKRQNTPPAKKLEDSPEAVHQPSKPTQKGGQLTKLLKNLMERFPNKERSDLIDAIVQVRKLHGNTLGGMAMAQVLFEVTQCLQNLEGQKQMDKQNDEEKDCCTVCLAPLKATQLVRELECAHRFHDQCIQLWFEKRERTCPVCRSHALLEDEFPRLQ